jgi:hypothetical protein
MSVILFRREHMGRIASTIINTPRYLEAMKLEQDRKEEGGYLKMDAEDIQNRAFHFCDRLYMANQLAYYLTYSSELDEDGSIKLARLQAEDLNVPAMDGKTLHEDLRSLDYHIISNAGRSMFSAEDLQRLTQLIEFTEKEPAITAIDEDIPDIWREALAEMEA